MLYYRRRVLRHTAHIAVYQSLSVRVVASRYTPSAADITDTSALHSVVIGVEVENVNTVSCVCWARIRSWKNVLTVLESSVKVLEFLSLKMWEP